MSSKVTKSAVYSNTTFCLTARKVTPEVFVIFQATAYVKFLHIFIHSWTQIYI